MVLWPFLSLEGIGESRRIEPFGNFRTHARKANSADQNKTPKNVPAYVVNLLVVMLIINAELQSFFSSSVHSSFPSSEYSVCGL